MDYNYFSFTAIIMIFSCFLNLHPLAAHSIPILDSHSMPVYCVTAVLLCVAFCVLLSGGLFQHVLHEFHEKSTDCIARK